MYRQILIFDEVQYLQLILLRNSSSNERSSYNLGTSEGSITSAPYIVTKWLAIGQSI